MNEVRFARNGSSHPLGKMDDEIRIDIHSIVRDLLRSKAHDAGMTEAEFIRNILYSHAYGGYEEYERILNERMRAALGIVTSHATQQRTG